MRKDFLMREWHSDRAWSAEGGVARPTAAGTGVFSWARSAVASRLAALSVFCGVLGGVCGIPVASAELFFTTQTMRQETRMVLQYLERQHFLRQSIDDLDMAEVVEGFLSDLDGQRAFFYQSEVTAFQKEYTPRLVSLLRAGRLDPAFEMYAAFSDRFNERIDWVMGRLGQPFDFSTDERYAADRSKASWPTDRLAADDLWERRLKYQLLNEILAEVSVEKAVEAVGLPGPVGSPEADVEGDQSASPLAGGVSVDPEAIIDPVVAEGFDSEGALKVAVEKVTKRYISLKESINDQDAIDVQERFLTALTQRYDPHSTFMSANTMEDFEIAMRNSLVGIGAVLTTDEGYCTIRELIAGGPAEKSGLLQPGDRIVGVAQGERGEMVDVIGMQLDRVVQKIRGEKGSVVRLLVQPAGADPSRRVEHLLVRDQIQLTSTLASARVITVPAGERTVPVGVIHLPGFYGEDKAAGTKNTTEDVAELIGQLKTLGIEALVLDLRNNGGGLLSESVRLTGLFIDRGPVVQVRDASGRLEQYQDTAAGVEWTGPLAVLVSRYSASASEITAGALQHHGRALIIGDPETHGKGTVQAVYRLDRSPFLTSMVSKRGAAKVTVQKFYLPDGSSTQLRGVRADVPLPTINLMLPIGEGDLTNALPWDTITPMSRRFSLGEVDTVDEELTGNLLSLSVDRLNQLDEFSYLRESIELFRERYERKEVSLNFQTRLAERATDQVVDEALRERALGLASLAYPETDVKLAIAKERERPRWEPSAVREPAEPATPVEEPGASIMPETVGGSEVADAEAVLVEEEPEPTEAFSAAEVIEEGELDEVDTLPGGGEPLDIVLRESVRIMADWVLLRGQKMASVAE